MSAAFTVGDQVRITVTFTAGGVNVDPTTVTYKVRTPAHVETSHVAPEVVQDALGVFHYDLTAAEAGGYRIRVEGEGDVIAADETYIYFVAD